MKIQKNIKKLINNLMLSSKRFPLVILSSTLTTLILIFIVNNNSSLADNSLEILEKLAMTAALAFPLFLIIKLSFERWQKFNENYRYLSYFAVLVFLTIHYFFILKDLNQLTISRFTALNIAFYLLALLVHYFYKREKYELYIAEILSRFFVSAVYTIVLFIGLAAVLFTVDKLFELSLSGEIYLTSWLIAVGIFAPIHLLAGLPEFEAEFSAADFSSFLRVLLFYIVMPLIVIYTLILYLYFVKIVVARDWPQNLLGHLVLWYALITFAVIFLIKPLKESSSWVRNFIFWMPKVIILPLIMMFSALWLRINQYGITENRYYVFLAGSWIFAVMLYYSFSKKQRNTVLILSLALITLVSVFGPWSSFALSIKSQNMRFEDILRENEMIKAGKIIKKDQIPAREVRKEINALIGYFNYNHSLADLKYLPADFEIKDMESIFGFKYQYYYTGNPKYFSHNLISINEILAIGEYDLLIDLNYNNYQQEVYSQNYDNLRLDFSAEEMRLKLFSEQELIFDKTLKAELVELHQLLELKEASSLNEKDLRYQYEDEKIKMKIIFRDFSGRVYDTNPNTIELQRLNGFLLIKLKN